MHRLAVKSNLVDSNSVSTTSKLGFAVEEKPIYPKPRRLGVPSEFLKPLPRCVKHRFGLQSNSFKFNDIRPHLILIQWPQLLFCSQSNAEERSHVFALIDDAKVRTWDDHIIQGFWPKIYCKKSNEICVNRRRNRVTKNGNWRDLQVVAAAAIQRV